MVYSEVTVYKWQTKAKTIENDFEKLSRGVDYFCPTLLVPRLCLTTWSL
jgi:hypothetical protein